MIDVDALIPPLSGIGKYTFNLVSALQSSSIIEELRYIQAGKIIKEFRPSQGTNSARQVARKLPLRSVIRSARQFYISRRFEKQSRAVSDFIYHAPNYMLLPFKGQSVVTIHDLSFLRHPEFHPSDRVHFWKKHIHTVVNRADQIITDSIFQRREICELLNVDESKVSSVHLGVDKDYRPYEAFECSEILQKYNLTYKQFNLVVSTIEPRKNFERIIQAFSALSHSLKKAYPLVIAGDKGWLSEEIHSEIEKLITAGYAKKLGYVAEKDLPRLYASAAVFIYPSLYEGFGLPVLEAMACGTCVLTSNSSSIPEVAGDSCILIDPYSIEEIKTGWEQLLSNQSLQEEYSLLGIAQAKGFTWEKCLNETLSIYQKVS